MAFYEPTVEEIYERARQVREERTERQRLVGDAHGARGPRVRRMSLPRAAKHWRGFP